MKHADNTLLVTVAGRGRLESFHVPIHVQAGGQDGNAQSEPVINHEFGNGNPSLTMHSTRQISIFANSWLKPQTRHWKGATQ